MAGALLQKGGPVSCGSRMQQQRSCQAMIASCRACSAIFDSKRPLCSALQVEVRASSRRKAGQSTADSAIGKIAAAHAQREERAKKKQQEEEEKQEQRRREKQQQEEEQEAEEDEVYTGGLSISQSQHCQCCTWHNVVI